ncbi:MAG TPA: AbrB/MazE/SpoVT family DNA-binding domain-containing protein [Sphingomonadaceae bacterium]|nr:AbrB/MazE/SpoVT family DNA-binding domain-containing protein [Sphingomonadaceae bacterium]
MSNQTRLSAKGQVVIPKDVRDALRWTPGLELSIIRSGDRLILEPRRAPRERITYEEFRRRVPRHEGPAATIEDMNRAVDRMFAERGRL